MENAQGISHGNIDHRAKTGLAPVIHVYNVHVFEYSFFFTEETKPTPEKAASKGKSKKGVNFDDEDSGDKAVPMDYGGDTDSGGDTEDELERWVPLTTCSV